MHISSRRTTLAAALAVTALALGGCSAGAPSAEDRPVSASATPSVSQPPSTPLQERTLTDEVDGTTVTALAIVDDFPVPEGTSSGLRPLLVQVRLEAGDEYGGSVFPYRVSVTTRAVNLDAVTLGLGTPEELKKPMSTAGYTQLQATPAGETATGWIGAWVRTDETEFDLVYDRREGKVIGGSKSGEVVPPSRDIIPLIPKD
ncbi:MULTISPECIES: hypothetical protein [unclassified Plantibacter]|jgi:hypothetical protein|uniref:hypothetical protein n=1 Tax=unclassified Plantibacter TaxID=2624265 RepID=UPI00254B7236|nr:MULTISPECIES: hypothetical protein [unclassified Plantibacter]